jgi:hypothetical protein
VLARPDFPITFQISHYATFYEVIVQYSLAYLSTHWLVGAYYLSSDALRAALNTCSAEPLLDTISRAPSMP